MTGERAGLVVARAGALAQSVDVRTYAEASHRPNTRRAYAGDLKRWERWCREHGRSAWPIDPDDLAQHLAAMAREGAAHSTVARRRAALSALCTQAGCEPNPARAAIVANVMRGIEATHGRAPRRPGTPLMPRAIRRYLERVDVTTPQGARERLVLVLGLALGARRSELAALRWGDVEHTDEGLRVRFRRSKTDARGKGATVGVPYQSTALVCPVRALADWQAHLTSAEPESPLLRAFDRRGLPSSRPMDARAVRATVQRLARALDLRGCYTAHSLRAGLATAAAEAGKSLQSIQAQGRWQGPGTLVDRYIRPASVFLDNAASGLLDR